MKSRATWTTKKTRTEPILSPSSSIELSWPEKGAARDQARTVHFPEFHCTARYRAGEPLAPSLALTGARAGARAGAKGAARSARSARSGRGGQKLFPSPPVLSPGTHTLLEGDNIHALRALHAAGVDFHFIYIDPPYNSGQNFTYRDKQGGHDSSGSGSSASGSTRSGSTRSGSRLGDGGIPCSESAWLSFMYPRLAWAHKVLREDGVLFVSIDDRQHASLVLLLNEIFGKAGHVATLKWRKKRKPSFLDAHMSSVVEYILVYARDPAKLPRFRGEETQETTRPVLNAANAEGDRILRRGTEARCADGLYKKGAYVNRTLGIELLEDAHVVKGCLAEAVRVRGRFRVSQEILDKSVFVTAQFGLRRHVLAEEKSHKHVSDDCAGWPTNEDAETELRSIFGTRVFDYAKPVGLVRNLLAMCPVRGHEEFRCLDFFAGSGTLAEAVLAQNAADAANRMFTCVQSPERITAKGVPSNLTTIFEITLARANHAHARFDDGRVLEVFSSRERSTLP